MGAEGLEVWHHELLPEGLREQDDVALDTPEGRDELQLADELWPRPAADPVRHLPECESMSAALLRPHTVMF